MFCRYWLKSLIIKPHVWWAVWSFRSLSTTTKFSLPIFKVFFFSNETNVKLKTQKGSQLLYLYLDFTRWYLHEVIELHKSYSRDNFGSVCLANHDHVSGSQLQCRTLHWCVLALIKSEAKQLSKLQSTFNKKLSHSRLALTGMPFHHVFQVGLRTGRRRGEINISHRNTFLREKKSFPPAWHTSYTFLPLSSSTSFFFFIFCVCINI